jgi:hypothetical protein
MTRITSNIYMQPIVVLATPGSQPADAFGGLPANPEGIQIERVESTVAGVINQTLAPSQILRTTFSTIPVVWEAELAGQYQELGEALGQMSELGEGDEWGIEPPVYAAACFVATELMLNSFPAPRVFNHGSKSVVFNWMPGMNNLYLTVSADKISALVSSAERIRWRMEFSVRQLSSPEVLLSTIQSANLEQPVHQRLEGTLPTPLVSVD